MGEARCSWKRDGHLGANLPTELQVCSVMYFVKLKRAFPFRAKRLRAQIRHINSTSFHYYRNYFLILRVMVVNYHYISKSLVLTGLYYTTTEKSQIDLKVKENNSIVDNFKAFPLRVSTQTQELYYCLYNIF